MWGGDPAFYVFVLFWPGVAVVLTLAILAALINKAVHRCQEGRLQWKGSAADVAELAEVVPAQPQVLRLEGKATEVWPQQWGMTLGQCKQFLAECQADEQWDPRCNLYNLVEKFVKPRTSGTGLSLALLVNEARPLEVNVMVSHAWCENAEDFFRALELTVSEEDVLFICAFSLYQCQDAEGPSIVEQLGSVPTDSPFYRVLRHIRRKGQRDGVLWRCHDLIGMIAAFCGVLASTLLYGPVIVAGCIPALGHRWEGVCFHSGSSIAHANFCFGAFRGDWSHSEHVAVRRISPHICLPSAMICAACALLITYSVRAAAAYRGRMVVVPNRECDIYSRLWCVYEIFVASTLEVPVVLAHTLAAAGHGSSREAICGDRDDMLRIRGEIEAYGQRTSGDGERGYDLVDRSIFLTTRSTRYTLLIPTIMQFWPVMLVQISLVRLCVEVPQDCNILWGSLATVCFTLATSVAISALYRLSKRRQGRLEHTDAFRAAALFVLVGGVLASTLFILADHLPDASVHYVLPWMLFGTTLITSGASLGLLTAVDRAMPSRGSSRRSFAGLVARMSWYGQFGIIILAALGGTRLPAAATVSFYCVLVFSFLGYPATLLSVARMWDIRFAKRPLAEVQAPCRCL